jgi:hypothetical protein
MHYCKEWRGCHKRYLVLLLVGSHYWNFSADGGAANDRMHCYKQKSRMLQTVLGVATIGITFLGFLLLKGSYPAPREGVNRCYPIFSSYSI